MRKWLCAWLLAVGVLAPVLASALEVTDDRGVTVRFQAPPQRIVSILPSLTESVCALGHCGRIVGVDRHSNYPASVRALPQVGGGIDPSIEAVVGLRPDVVLMSRASRGAERLERLGIRVLALEPRTLDDVRRVLDVLGALLQVPEAQRVWRDIDAAVTHAALRVPPQMRGARVYFEVSRGPYAAGPTSFLGELLQRLGLANIIGPELGAFPKINPEYVVRADPDIVMVGDRSAEGLLDRPGWPRMRAMRNGHVCVFKPQESDVLVRPGPRLSEAAALLVRCVSGGRP